MQAYVAILETVTEIRQIGPPADVEDSAEGQEEPPGDGEEALVAPQLQTRTFQVEILKYIASSHPGA